MKNEANIPSCTDCPNNSGVLCALSMLEKNELGKHKGNHFYKKGEKIFTEGKQSRGLFCIYKGKIKISKLGEGGKDQVIRLAKTADILGYRSLLNGEPYKATATALEDSYICLLSKNKFIELMKSNPELAWNTILLLSNDLKKAENHIINIAQKTVKERIASAILLMYSTFGFLNDDKSINVILTRSEISDIAGTTTETTIRTLTALKNEGIILTEGKRIIIPNLTKLAIVVGIHD